MKKTDMLRYSISFFLFFVFFSVFSQEKEQDTTRYKDRYGLRVGVDLFTPVYSLFDEDTKGWEVVADYRISKRFWVAGEFGFKEHTTFEDYFNFTSKGTFFRIGGDFNAYKNFLGLENMIQVGLRYGYSSFSQTLNQYTINSNPYLPLEINNIPVEYDNLNAHWIEGILGLKVEVLHNLYLGMALSGKVMISTKDAEGFKNLYAPGFNRIYVNDYGFGFNYTISYLFPFYRK